MAEIKMDISEYEIMKDNKKLLESSLEREKELSNEIQKLQQEKIQALEDAKMKVVKISKTKRSEFFYRKRDPFVSIITELPPKTYYIEDVLSSEKMINKILEDNFEKIDRVINEPDQIIVTGLDEVKQELREEVSSEYKEKIASLESSIEKYSNLVAINELLEAKNKSLIKAIDEMDFKLNNKKNKIRSLNDEIDLLKERVLSLSTVAKFNESIINKYKSNFIYSKLIKKLKICDNL
jgi:hypothetical protein